MDRFRKRKDITPTQSEAKKSTSQSNQASSVMSSLSSSLAAIMNNQRPARNSNTDSHASFESSRSTQAANSPIGFVKNGGKIDENDLGGIKAGKLRNIVEVEVMLVDGEEVKSPISEEEAYNYIAILSLGLKKHQVFGVQMYMRDHPIVQFRLKSQIDVEKLPNNFSYTKTFTDREGKTFHQKVVCQLLGVRDPNLQIPREPRQKVEEDPNGPWIRWVKLEGMGFDFNKENLEGWLRCFGSLQSEFERDVIKIRELFPDEDTTNDPEPGVATLATGKLSIKMEITDPIPQFLPAWGKKIRVYYRGIDKLCLNCYESGHMRSDCTNGRVSWIEYVASFKDAFPQIQQKQYGRWNNVLAAWKATNSNHD